MGGVQTYGASNIQGASKHCSRLKRVPTVLHIWGQPNIQQGIQIYGWCPNMGASKYMGGVQTWGACKHTGGVKTYEGIQTYRGPSKHMGHPNIQDASTYMGASKCMGAYGHPLSVT